MYKSSRLSLFFIAYLLGMYYHIRYTFLANVSIQLACSTICIYIQCSFASSTSSYSHTLIVYFFYYDAMTEERLEIGKYSNLSSSYHLLLYAVYTKRRGVNLCINMYICIRITLCAISRKKENNFYSIPHHTPHLNPKNTSFIHSPKPTRYKTFCNLIALSHETAASEKVALHEHENRCEGECDGKKRERERRRRKYFSTR